MVPGKGLMRVAKIDPIVVGVLYRRREHSTRAQRDGVTNVLVWVENVSL
jgi:hypothetical protein